MPQRASRTPFCQCGRGHRSEGRRIIRAPSRQHRAHHEHHRGPDRRSASASRIRTARLPSIGWSACWASTASPPSCRAMRETSCTRSCVLAAPFSCSVPRRRMAATGWAHRSVPRHWRSLPATTRQSTQSTRASRMTALASLAELCYTSYGEHGGSYGFTCLDAEDNRWSIGTYHPTQHPAESASSTA